MRAIVAAALLTACSRPAPAPAPAPPRPETAQQGNGSITVPDANQIAVESAPDADVSAVATTAETGVTGSGSAGTYSIGPGRYQQIGKNAGPGIHAATTPTGAGVPAHAGPALPMITLGQPTVSPGDTVINKELVRRFIKRNLQKIQDCYAFFLVDNPTLAGTVIAKFSIGFNGVVSSSSASGLDPKVESCIAQVIKAIEFPKQMYTSAVIDVAYPFAFRPARR